jgi:hypothetical protein
MNIKTTVALTLGVLLLGGCTVMGADHGGTRATATNGLVAVATTKSR